jgi:hypothetical protein
MGSQPEIDPSSPAWEKYYADASRRRRERRKQGHDRDDRRRRKIIERVLLLGSLVFLGGLTLLFHVVLTR